MAGREKLDNLIFVINCNLQRLDGPVRGNGKIIQELEGIFRGAGWNVIKVLWGSGWDPLIARDTTGMLLKRMEECVDGEYQDFKSKNGAYVREHFFGKYPELLEMVAGMTDDEIWALNRGGHDPQQGLRRLLGGRANQRPAHRHPRQDRQGLWHGRGRRGPEHHPPAEEDGRGRAARFRDRFDLPLTDEQLTEIPFLRFPDDSPEMAYLRERAPPSAATCRPGGPGRASRWRCPPLSAFAAQLAGTPGREISTTMAFVRILNTLLRDKKIGKRVVPIVPDESRTFGMEGMFRQFGIFSQVGQLYRPRGRQPAHVLPGGPDGQILQEGINEAGAMSSWIAAATSYSTNDVPMIPFYIYYSMFGFQRVRTWPGQPATCGPAASCSAAPPAAPR